MNTPTHMLLGAAVLARPVRSAPDRWCNGAVLLGALAPDLGLYVLFVWARLIQGISEHTLWRTVYWQDSWQDILAIGNSVPLYLGLALGGIALRRYRVGDLLMLFATSALLHVAFDLPFHADDAHRHFWPFSNWAFHSPLSYWDKAHYGSIVAGAERALGVMLSLILWRRFPSRLVRAVLIVSLSFYILVPLYFGLMLGD